MEITLKIIGDFQAPLLSLGCDTSEEYKNRNKNRGAMERLAEKYQMLQHEMEKKIPI